MANNVCSFWDYFFRTVYVFCCCFLFACFVFWSERRSKSEAWAGNGRRRKPIEILGLAFSTCIAFWGKPICSCLCIWNEHFTPTLFIKSIYSREVNGLSYTIKQNSVTRYSVYSCCCYYWSCHSFLSQMLSPVGLSLVKLSETTRGAVNN